MEYRVRFFEGDSVLYEYGEDEIVSGKIDADLFGGGKLSVGGTVAKQAEIAIIDPLVNGEESIPRACPFVIEFKNGSAWEMLGRYYIDTRERSRSTPDLLKIKGFDAMLKGEVEFFPGGSTISGYPKLDTAVISEVCSRLGVTLNPKTALENGFMIPFPGTGEGGFTVNEVLGQIGAMYGGNWFIDNNDYLTLSVVGDIPTRGAEFLIDENGAALKIGGVRIIV